MVEAWIARDKEEDKQWVIALNENTKLVSCSCKKFLLSNNCDHILAVQQARSNDLPFIESESILVQRVEKLPDGLQQRLGAFRTDTGYTLLLDRLIASGQSVLVRESKEFQNTLAIAMKINSLHPERAIETAMKLYLEILDRADKKAGEIEKRLEKKGASKW